MPQETYNIEKILQDKYIVKQNIGKGGMGSVYKVVSIADNSVYAAKVIVEADYCDGRAEAEILMQLHHPMLPEVKEYFVCEGVTIIIMEFIRGCNMAEYIEKEGVISKGKINVIMRQLSDVLLYMHSQDPPVIYRDLKPSNIMLEGKERLRLIDFGTARSYKRYVNNDTIALGTPGYAAPEQLMGSTQSDVRTDIYSLGATMYFLITGVDISKPPFEAEPIHMVRSGIDSGIEEIISRCMQKNPNKRFQTITELLAELDRVECPMSDRQMKNYTPINIMITHSGKNILR